MNRLRREGARWMPKHQELKKDGTNTEIPRGAVSKLRTGGIRMGKPSYCKR